MRRVEFYIQDIRLAVDANISTTPNDISDQEILQYINAAQFHLYSKIVLAHPNLKVNTTFISLIANQELYNLPVDCHLGSAIKQVDYKYSIGQNDFRMLDEAPLSARLSTLTVDPPRFYIRQDTHLLINPIPATSQTNAIRLTYYNKIKRLDVRRGFISSINKTSLTLNTITISLNPSLNKDDGTMAAAADQLNKADYICVIDKDGNSILNSIPIDSYDSSTGIITVRTGYSTNLTSTDLNNQYIVIGDNSSTHSSMPDETIERYSILYATARLKFRQGLTAEATLLMQEVQSVESELINAYANIDHNLVRLPPDNTWQEVGLIGNNYTYLGSSGGIGGGGGGAGTITGAQNIGVGGVGPYFGLAGSILDFKNIAPASNKVVVTDDPGNFQIDIDIDPTKIDHNTLLNFVANKHIDHSTVVLTAGEGLTGGGDITANRTFALDFTDLSTTASSAISADILSLNNTATQKKITFANFESSLTITNLTGTLSVAKGGTGLTALTAHNLIVGNGTSNPNLLVPSATSGIPIISQGVSADPIYGTALVAGGGTGLTSLTAHNLIVGNGTSPATLLAPSVTSGVPLISQGSSADPIYSTLPVGGGGSGATTLTAHGVLIGEGTSPIVATVAGTAGQHLQSGGAAADPTWTSTTYPSTSAQGDLLYGSATNVLSSLAKNTTATRYLANTGTTNNPNWDQVALTTGVTGTLPVGNGGTGVANPTAHDLLIGNGSSAMTQLAPSATSGVPLISQGSAADPAFGTAVVAGGGTGNTTFTAYSVICAGTTATGAFQNVSGVGTSGQVLTSNGASALPTWQAAGGSSGIVQRVSTTLTTWSDNTATIPLDDTIPQNTEGTQIMTQAITPNNTNNKLVIEAWVHFSSSFSTTFPTALITLFQDSTANALAMAGENVQNSAVSAISTIYLRYTMTAGTTSSTTFKIRCGLSATSSPHMYVNGDNSTRIYGGAAISTLMITEMTA